MTINENQKKFHRSTTLNLRIPTTKSEDESATFVYVCRSCNAVLEMFKTRSQAIVFKSFLTTKKMKKLQTKLFTNWKEKNIFFICLNLDYINYIQINNKNIKLRSCSFLFIYTVGRTGVGAGLSNRRRPKRPGSGSEALNLRILQYIRVHT